MEDMVPITTTFWEAVCIGILIGCIISIIWVVFIDDEKQPRTKNNEDIIDFGDKPPSKKNICINPHKSARLPIKSHNSSRRQKRF